jgi:pantoate kinase
MKAHNCRPRERGAESGIQKVADAYKTDVESLRGVLSRKKRIEKEIRTGGYPLPVRRGFRVSGAVALRMKKGPE